MGPREIAIAAARVLDDKKGDEVIVLDVSGMTVITDYMVIATGHSVPQVKSLCEHAEEELAKLEVFARRREGLGEGHWCILDYGDVMVHIFHEKDRAYYQLERLWDNGENEVPFIKDETAEGGE